MSAIIIYLIVLVLLLAAELFYFRIADRFNIIDKPNERSSHNYITIRGGGVIWWVAALLYLLFNLSVTAGWFLAGITLIAGVSFVDDVKGLGQKMRLLFHLLAMSCAFYLAGVFGSYPWWAIVIGYVVFIGIVNAYNFMDGINGITGLYSIAVLASLQYVNLSYGNFVPPDLIWYPMIASLVFLFFNFRKRARCFAGDVGSVGIAFWIVTLLLILIIKTENLIWIGFLMVYGIDTVITILHRIYLKQNIMEAHRLHFYQILANEKKIPHRLVSLIYFTVQLLCSALIILFYPVLGWGIFVILLLLLMGLYMIKFPMMNAKKCDVC
ncbi:UDP-GlcNAc:UDP-phosphate GlcNAc-1-phosphate transferase {ECO:0000313/EMBL:KIO54190,1} [Petrimonas mucosa]|jgi:UDP-N-acetylmuramyl pentapeptide phosphotransferase/UDP-N-acetylglucosamine-1-phosphate transferase|uniref:UDP-GlcNAc:UDP-phosphate GlcNAc-1-phosphate transferase n=1 Tax=Petrimonas mucosa TaxID=1642646 RepID=A0A1G4GAS9_9BACT|nr:UDP-GlcNAc:UDP-phosphate GlcNAc-1-phosphate transferase {ECO:0000313/EMBL:KIO54190,1} [Petrimonas mucosa]